MNVLVLTPDAVGSTLLQRLITIYMQFHEFDRPVINLHELTNGLETYWSPDFGRKVVSKKKVTKWGYYQTLEQIVDVLNSVDHYKTSRLAHYHLRNRQDSLAQQIPFYHYLNENFFIIACRRTNVFEHAISMALTKIHKRLNVYSHREKIDTLGSLYINPVDIDIHSLHNQLEAYRLYLKWSENHFHIGSYFNYENHMPQIEKYILALPIFHQAKKLVTWHDKFDIDFNDWNRCHHIPSDIGAVTMSSQFDATIPELGLDNFVSDEMIKNYQQNAPAEWPPVYNQNDFQILPVEIKRQFALDHYNTLVRHLPSAYKIYHDNYVDRYQKANETIKRMQELDIIITPPPIKKQTLVEKMHLIKNWQQCIDFYNGWIAGNSEVASEISAQDITNQMSEENTYWHEEVIAKVTALTQPRAAMLGYQNDDHL